MLILDSHTLFLSELDHLHIAPPVLLLSVSLSHLAILLASITRDTNRFLRSENPVTPPSLERCSVSHPNRKPRVIEH